MSSSLNTSKLKLEKENEKAADNATKESRELIKQLGVLITVLLALTSILFTNELFVRSINKWDGYLIAAMLLAFLFGLFLGVYQIYVDFGFWEKHTQKLREGILKIHFSNVSEADEEAFLHDTFDEIYNFDDRKKNIVSSGIPLKLAYGLLLFGVAVFIYLLFKVLVLQDFDTLPENPSQPELAQEECLHHQKFHQPFYGVPRPGLGL